MKIVSLLYIIIFLSLKTWAGGSSYEHVGDIDISYNTQSSKLDFFLINEVGDRTPINLSNYYGDHLELIFYKVRLEGEMLDYKILPTNLYFDRYLQEEQIQKNMKVLNHYLKQTSFYSFNRFLYGNGVPLSDNYFLTYVKEDKTWAIVKTYSKKTRDPELSRTRKELIRGRGRLSIDIDSEYSVPKIRFNIEALDKGSTFRILDHKFEDKISFRFQRYCDSYLMKLVDTRVMFQGM